MSEYSTREVADLLGFKTHQVRHYVRRRLLAPRRGERGEFRFSFQDVVLLRAAKGLLDAEVPVRKAYRVLVKLRESLPETMRQQPGNSLAGLRFFAKGQQVLVRAARQLWNVETGQGHFDFDGLDRVAESAAGKVTRLHREPLVNLSDLDDLSSDEWYNLGLDLEEVESDKAPEAYRRALALDPENADAHVNLGRLSQLSGDLKQAKRHYELALQAVPGHQLANYNLGTLFDELDELQKAADYYSLAASVPDAHYNLARIHELRGDEISARRHMRRYHAMLSAD